MAPPRVLFLCLGVWLLSLGLGLRVDAEVVEYPARSGLATWVDPETPEDRWSYVNSRGRRWELVMSDEFNTPDRDFRPGKDHLWTSLEKPDGVNGAKETYSHNMTSTACDADGTCYFYIKTMEDHQVLHVYNMYLNPPAYETVEFFYRAAMVQSWNKFCFQGGMLEVRAQLPGAISAKSGNPDIARGPNSKTTALDYYPTWPGIWMMGNLGRAIFSGSTNRMWPFSYDRCEPDVFNPRNQRISACDSNPGFGLNPNQGRGAPEIDLLEGGGVAISSSLQIGPGMPLDFRMFPVNETIDNNNYGCIYGGSCKTPGANQPDVPTALYAKRGYKSWYQGLRYQTNPFCAPDKALQQDYATIAKSVTTGIKENACTATNCPGSTDANADLGLVDGKGTTHWGINYNGTCFPVMNAYTGAYLCDPDNQYEQCSSPRPDDRPKSDIMKPFNYQMDAISSNWPVHLGAYTGYEVYQLEWVTGRNGYVRWMLAGHPLFEVTSEAIENVPQDAKKRNPRKLMLEEPMYLIMNVAMSATWGSHPPNPFGKCRGDGKDPKANRICDELPMYLKVDYMRLYQDRGTDLEPGNYMQLGCDPASHPTKGWIEGHIDEYQDFDNLVVTVAGGAVCRTDEDCTVQRTGSLQYTRLTTGKCVNKRCKCTHGESWGGPRCTTAISVQETTKTGEGFGPPFELGMSVALLVILATGVAVWRGQKKVAVMAARVQQQAKKQPRKEPQVLIEETPRGSAELGASGPVNRNVHFDYQRNFV